jgi:hypothetical protein
MNKLPIHRNIAKIESSEISKSNFIFIQKLLFLTMFAATIIYYAFGLNTINSLLKMQLI